MTMQTKPTLSFPHRHERNWHEQAALEWQGDTIMVDRSLVPLLQAFNAIPGVATVASCECIQNKGDCKNKGMLAFTGDDYVTALRVAIRILQEAETSKLPIHIVTKDEQEMVLLYWNPIDKAQMVALFRRVQ